MNIGSKIISWLILNHKDSVKFVPDGYLLDKISDLIWAEKYSTLLLEIGIIAYLGIIQWYIEKEMFEECQTMIEVIKNYNEKYQFNLPVDFFDEQIIEWMKLTPTEFLNLKV